MWCRSVWEKFRSIEYEEFVNAIRQNLFFNLAFDIGTDDDSMELYAELVGELASFRQQFLRDLLNEGVLYLYIYKYVVHAYPMIFSSNNSLIIPSTSASEAVKVFDSFAWNTMFFTAFTFVGEPERPHWSASPSTSATLHWLSVR